MRRIIGVISVFSVMEAFGILLSLGLGARAAGENVTDASCFTLSGGVIKNYNTGDTKCGVDVIIPSNINGMTITEIGEKAFYEKGLTSVTIPSTVTKIGNSAFAGNDIKNLILPDSITTVSYAAFQGNKNLEKIKLSKSMEYLPADFCDGCNIKELVGGIPNSIKKIYTTAFYARGSQENGGGYTVWTNPTFRNMDKMIIPESVTNIYGGGFGALWSNTYEILSKDIDIDRVTSYARNLVIFKLTKGAKVKYSINNLPGHSTSRDPTYVSISNLEEDGVAVNFIISGDYTVFQPVAVGLKKGTKVTYPADIELTGYTLEGWYKDEEFNEKFDINSNVINENITLYGKLNSKPCWEFTVTDEENKEVELKKFHIEYPHCSAWYNENYETFTIPTKVPSGLKYEGYDVIGIGDTAFCNKEYQNGMGEVERSFVGKIIIPDGIRYIGAKSFKNSSLSYIELPNSIESIGEQAFFANYRLTGVKRSENLKTIGSNAFAYSARLTKGKFPDSLKYIGDASFHESGISEIEFGTGSQLESVGYLAFGYSDSYNGPQYGNIKKITFPKSLKRIDNSAFLNNKVEEVTLLCDSCTVYQDAFKIEGRSDRQIPGYKRRNADIKNYDLHLVLTGIVETYKITLDSDGATKKGTENLWYDLGTPIYYLDKEKKNTIDGGITIPTKEGYSFQGYFTEKNGNGLKYISNLGVIGKIYNIDSDTVLYASWKKDEEQDNTHNAASSDCNGLSNPKREGYKFIGWYTDKNYTKLYNPNELVTGELTLYSKWEKEGGNSGGSNNQGDDGSDDSNDSSDDGSTDDSTDDNDNTSNDNTSNDNNIKNSVTYSVKHFKETLTGGYELALPETFKAESGSQVTPPVKSFSGYITPSKKTITVKGDGSSVVEYQYGRIKYKVTVEKGAGVSAVKGDGEYKYGQNVSIRATPLAGYKIIGFDGDIKTGSFTMPAKDINIIVKAEKDDTKYKISYDYNGGKLESGKKVNPDTYTTNSQSFNLNPPVKTGFIFAGRQESINGKLVGTKTYVSIPKGSSGNRSYKAMWKKEGEVEEVIYNQQEDLNGEYNTVEVILLDSNGDVGNNVGGNGSSSTPRNYEGFITPTDFSKQSDSSNLNQGAVGEVLNLSDGVAVIIYKYKRDSFTLTIDKDEGIESVEGAGTYKYQQPVSIKVKVKSGYTFAGFEGEINVSDFEMPAKNLIIKATSTKK